MPGHVSRRVAEAARLSSPKQITIGGRSHAVGRPTSALARNLTGSPQAASQHPQSDSRAALSQQRTLRQMSGTSTPVQSGAATPSRRGAGGDDSNRSHANAVVNALGQLSPHEVDRLQRVLQQGQSS